MPFDYIDGRFARQTEVVDDYTLLGTHIGSVRVSAGKFILRGTLNGSLDVGESTIAEIIGKQNGSVSIGHGAQVSVDGEINGSVSVATGATLLIQQGAKLAGSLDNDGLVVLRGTFGGSQSGKGEVRVEGGHIKEPVIRGGIAFYEW